MKMMRLNQNTNQYHLGRHAKFGKCGRNANARQAAGWSALAATALLLCVGSGGQAGAQGISVTINGQPVQFQDIGPQQINGRTLVPVRGVLEKLGANIAFVSQSQTVIASTPTIDIQLKIGSRLATVNGRQVTLDVPAQSIRDHTFVPLRFIGEALGADLAWDPATRTVRILTKDNLNAGGNPPPRGNSPASKPPPRTTPGSNITPTIDSFTQDAKSWLHAGETLHVVLEGTPGGQASFRIPGLTEAVMMRETSAGRYVGEWQVPANKPLHLKSAAVIGSLKIGSKSAPLLQAGQTLAVDALPPRVRDRAPETDAKVGDARPNISAVFEDEGSGINRDSVRLVLNGRDVTADATVTRDFITYRPAAPLSAGPQEVQLFVSDMAGNKVESHWAFIEQARAGGGIKSVSDNVQGVLQPGDVLHVEMNGSPGGRATFSTGSIQNVPMQENQPGHYRADYTIRKGDDIREKPIAFHLVTSEGEKFEQSSARALQVSTGKPATPVVTSPGPNDAPGNPLVVKGKATPNSKVHVKVDYKNKVLGLIALQGTAADTTVQADKNGNWQTAPINIGGLFGNQGVEYTISATAINAADEKSDTATTKFRIK